MNPPKTKGIVTFYSQDNTLDEGYIFGDEGKGFERINMASPRSMIVECMERIHKALKPEV